MNAEPILSLEPKDMELTEVQAFLLGGVAPRPIALVSTLSESGVRNLAPFSFFNAFGSNPPTVAFSASSRIRDNSSKDTLANLIATKECVIQVVTHAMVQQVSLTSSDFESEVDEFVKGGLTPLESDIVKPFRVAQSPFQMECRLNQLISLGDGPGSGNLAICEVVKFHVDESLLVEGKIDPNRLDAVARMGGDYYTRTGGESLFLIKKSRGVIGIGFDRLPDFVRESSFLSQNQLAQLAESTSLPTNEVVEEQALAHRSDPFSQEDFSSAQSRGDFEAMYRMALSLLDQKSQVTTELLFKVAAEALKAGNPGFAWGAILLTRETARST